MPRRLALEALRLVEERDEYVRDVLDDLARARDLPPRDRDLALELAQGVLRCEGALDAVLGSRTRKPLDRADATVRRVLRIGAYQILWLDRVPTHAAVDTSVELARASGRGGAAGFVNAVLRGVARLKQDIGGGHGDDPRTTIPRGDGTHIVLKEPVLPDPAKDRLASLAARWSHPRWLVERFLAQHGEDGVLRLLEAGIARPAVSIRPIGAHREELVRALAERGIEADPEGVCLLVRGAGRVEDLPGWEEGWFTVQDPTAAEVVPLLDPRPRDAVLELCAAPGGKTLALSEAVGPDGGVVAVDLPGDRTARLRAELIRRGVSNVLVVEADAAEDARLPKGPVGRGVAGFDLVLLDAPCTNTGVLARRVEARWRLGPEDLPGLVGLQSVLLDVAGSKLRPGGRLAYSTCSVDRDENEAVVRAFLTRTNGFELLREEVRLPDAGRRGGGYCAVLQSAPPAPRRAR